MEIYSNNPHELKKIQEKQNLITHQIEKLFMRASKFKIPNETYLTPSERESYDLKRKKDGTKRIKRKLLGFCGKESIKTLDEIALGLYELGVTSSLKDSRNLVPLLPKITPINYHDCPGKGALCLGFDVASNELGDEKYKVVAFMDKGFCI